MTASRIRQATQEDAKLLARLGRDTFIQTFGHTYSAEDLDAFLNEQYGPRQQAAELAARNSRFWIAEVKSEAVGFIHTCPCRLAVPEPCATDGEIKRLYLLNKAQGSGMGTQLLLTALDWLKQEGYAPVYLSVWENNHGAQRLYQRHGFREVGEYQFPVGNHMDRELIYRRDA